MKEVLADKIEDIIKKNSKVIVDVYADWCGPCKMLAPILDEVDNNTDITVVKINADDKVNSEYITKFNIVSIPTTIYYKDGVTFSVESGVNPKAFHINKFE
jgi:thioredoxin 1